MLRKFVLYNEIEVNEDEVVDCIYFVGGDCRAQPFSLTVGLGAKGGFYKPTDEEIRKYCKADFTECPRYKAYIEYLVAANLQK